MESLARSLISAFPVISGVPLWAVTLLVMVVVAAVLLVFMLTFGGLGSYVLRKVAGDIQVRIGPNRVGPYGLLQFLADGAKLILKEDIIPAKADRFLFILAPYLVFVGSFAAFVVLPFGVGLTPAVLTFGISSVRASPSLVVIGTLMAGWAPTTSGRSWAGCARWPRSSPTKSLWGWRCCQRC